MCIRVTTLHKYKSNDLLLKRLRCQTSRTHRARSSPSDGACDPSSHHMARCVAAAQSGASRATSRPRRAAMLLLQLHLSQLREAHWPPWRPSCAFATACASTTSLAMMRRTPPRADDLLAWLRGRHRGVDGRRLSGHFGREPCHGARNSALHALKLEPRTLPPPSRLQRVINRHQLRDPWRIGTSPQSYIALASAYK